MKGGYQIIGGIDVEEAESVETKPSDIEDD